MLNHTKKSCLEGFAECYHIESELTWVHCAFDEDGMDLLRATEGTTSFTVFSQAMGEGERGSILFKRMW